MSGYINKKLQIGVSRPMDMERIWTILDILALYFLSKVWTFKHAVFVFKSPTWRKTRENYYKIWNCFLLIRHVHYIYMIRYQTSKAMCNSSVEIKTFRVIHMFNK